jgi:hypothetical protein
MYVLALVVVAGLGLFMPKGKVQVEIKRQKGELSITLKNT